MKAHPKGGFVPQVDEQDLPVIFTQETGEDAVRRFEQLAQERRSEILPLLRAYRAWTDKTVPASKEWIAVSNRLHRLMDEIQRQAKIRDT